MRPDQPHRGQLTIEPGEHAAEVDGVAAGAHLEDRIRIAGAQSGVAADAAAAAHCQHTGLDALGD